MASLSILKGLFSLFLVLQITQLALAYSDRSAICQVTPQLMSQSVHAGSGDLTMAAWTTTLTFNADKSVSISLKGQGVLTGILLRIQDAKGAPIGTFSTLPTNTVVKATDEMNDGAASCGTGVVQHKAGFTSTNPVFKWSPPNGYTGTFQVQAIVINSSPTGWGIPSIKSASLNAAGTYTLLGDTTLAAPKYSALQQYKIYIAAGAAVFVLLSVGIIVRFTMKSRERRASKV